MGRQETIILRGEWDADRTKIVFTPPVELFNKMMIITPKNSPLQAYYMLSEVEINIDMIRPELFLEFKTMYIHNLSIQCGRPFCKLVIQPVRQSI